MTMGSSEKPLNGDAMAEEDEEFEEISVEITDDNYVWVHGEDWEIVLSPIEARQLADALRDAADDAEAPEEG